MSASIDMSYDSGHLPVLRLKTLGWYHLRLEVPKALSVYATATPLGPTSNLKNDSCI
jgi:hypothetical protein